MKGNDVPIPKAARRGRKRKVIVCIIYLPRIVGVWGFFIDL